MSKRLAAILVGVAALAILTGGCGGEDEEALTKTEFIKEADGICEEAQAEVAAETQALRKSQGLGGADLPSDAQFDELITEAYLPGVEKRLEGMKDLNPPTADEEEVEAIYTATEEATAAAEENSGLILEPGKDPFEESKELSQEYGFKVCGIS